MSDVITLAVSFEYGKSTVLSRGSARGCVLEIDGWYEQEGTSTVECADIRCGHRGNGSRKRPQRQKRQPEIRKWVTFGRRFGGVSFIRMHSD